MQVRGAYRPYWYVSADATAAIAEHAKFKSLPYRRRLDQGSPPGTRRTLTRSRKGCGNGKIRRGGFLFPSAPCLSHCLTLSLACLLGPAPQVTLDQGEGLSA